MFVEMCISPINIRHPTHSDERLTVPCGKCYECLSARKNAWVFRLMNEFNNSHSAKFITLTYDEENCPYDEYFEFYTFNKTHVQEFFRSLRDRIRYLCKKRGIPANDSRKFTNFRYFLVCEYGGDSMRPHYHLLLFNFPTELMDYYQIQNYWPYGFVHFDDVSRASIVYVCKYLFKPPFLKDCEVPNTFMLCSKSIGKSFLSKENRAYLNRTHSLVYDDGKEKFYLPRYYREKVFSKIESKNLGEKSRLEALEKRYNDMLRLGEKEYLRLYRQKTMRKINKMFTDKKTKL